MDIREALQGAWTPPPVPEDVPHGDMPGDRVVIDDTHIRKANAIFPALAQKLIACAGDHPQRRAVVAVCGGSGVGKSEIASLLSYYLRERGVGSYTLSGDNYPHRIPRDNDAERLRVYRAGGLRGLVASGLMTDEIMATLRQLWALDADAESAQEKPHPWLAVYRRAGRRCLGEYLGTRREIDFDELSELIARFKQGAEALLLKRMGRERDELWYERVDMRAVRVLMIEWTHGNSDHLEGVDIPVLLNSTPQETLAHRRARNRDGKTDSAFTTMVLEIEQHKLVGQAEKAAIILSKGGELLSWDDYRLLMAQA